MTNNFLNFANRNSIPFVSFLCDKTISCKNGKSWSPQRRKRMD